METDESLFHAVPQTRGKAAHETIDQKTASHSADDILALPIYSENYGLMGKIDVYRKKSKKLIERKFQLKQIFQGHIYQLWAQMFCLLEMGYEVESLAFYEISTKKEIPVALPTEEDKIQFAEFIKTFKAYNPATSPININKNKCQHCVYCNLCDKVQEDNVYT